MSERLLTARELAGLLGMSASTILDWHEAGRIPSFKLPTGPVRFRASEVEAWLEGCRRGPSFAPRKVSDDLTPSGSVRHSSKCPTVLHIPGGAND